MKPSSPSKMDSPPVKPFLARNAESSPLYTALPACNVLPIVPAWSASSNPADWVVARPRQLMVSSRFKSSNLEAQAAAAMVPIVPVLWNPLFLCSGFSILPRTIATSYAPTTASKNCFVVTFKPLPFRMSSQTMASTVEKTTVPGCRWASL